jgi:hypothetical protein
MQQCLHRSALPASVALEAKCNQHRVFGPPLTARASARNRGVHVSAPRSAPYVGRSGRRCTSANLGTFGQASLCPGSQGRFAPPCYAGQSVPAGAAQGGARFASSFGALLVGSQASNKSPHVRLVVMPATVALAGSLRFRGFVFGLPQRRLTRRSSGAPTACHRARAAARYILRSPGPLSYRRRPLSSNVRRHERPALNHRSPQVR